MMSYRSQWFSLAAAISSILTFVMLGESPAMAANIELYDVFETVVTNDKSYTNPFDYCEIELQAVFTSPSGKQVKFFGFHDGDGKGGQSGNVWKLRFMPQETGAWKYTYTWTDKTPGGEGAFHVVDNKKYPGPLKVAADTPWYFSTARGEPFHARGYMFGYGHEKPDKPGLKFNSDADQAEHFKTVDECIVKRGYNLVMIIGRGLKSMPATTTQPRQLVNEGQTWWCWDGRKYDFTRYQVATWTHWDRYIDAYRQRGVYVFPFALIHEWDIGDTIWQMGEMRRFTRYMMARCAAYSNLFGYNITWEMPIFFGDERSASYYSVLRENNPFGTLLGRHDNNHDGFKNVLDFTMRQRQARDVFRGNDRTATWHYKVDGVFVNRPIIGSEDIWEIASGEWSQPRNGDEVRRGAWGLQLAGVMPIYEEWHGPKHAPAKGLGKGDGEVLVRRMFDFFYDKPKIDYRNPKFQQLNALVSAKDRQICSGVPGQEYVVYDEDGGDITIDLSAAGDAAFTVTWFDPVDGTLKQGETVKGGANRTLASPFKGDSVLLLRKQAGPSSQPVAAHPGDSPAGG